LLANAEPDEHTFSFATSIMDSLAEATVDFMIHDPANSKTHRRVGFDALWRVAAKFFADK